jgi:hypothetical protein
VSQLLNMISMLFSLFHVKTIRENSLLYKNVTATYHRYQGTCPIPFLQCTTKLNFDFNVSNSSVLMSPRKIISVLSCLSYIILIQFCVVDPSLELLRKLQLMAANDKRKIRSANVTDTKKKNPR